MGCPGNLGDKLILALILPLSIILIMVNIKFYFSQDEEISEYSLGDIDITVDNQTLSSASDSRNAMMIFISLVDLSYGVVTLLKTSSKKSYEFVGTDSSFRFAIDRNQDKLTILSDQSKVTMHTTPDDLVNALWECWQDIEKYTSLISNESSIYLDLVDAKLSFQKAFESIL
jgi:hypothetical protein